MKQGNLLIVMMKNPIKGKVKTRLAATIGDEKALEIYLDLVNHTEQVCSVVSFCEKAIYYSDFIDQNSTWNDRNYQKHLQKGESLGERLHFAFNESFKVGYNKVLVIGTDCFEISPRIIQQAYDELDENEVVIGPARDGGYYLLGMRQFYSDLFSNIKWSTEWVLTQTLDKLKTANLHYTLLPVLSDIDREQDLPEKIKNKYDRRTSLYS
jgi:uncharacterized protein